MSNKIQTITSYIESDVVQSKLKQMFKDSQKLSTFIASVSSLVASNTDFKDVDKGTILNACVQAASLDLPVNSNLGFAYVIPYNNKAQLQIGYKGFKQLAIRSGQFKIMNATDVREGEITITNRLTGEIEFNWINDEVERKSKPIVGYVSYFQLLQGFSKTLYRTKVEIELHAKRYSKTYKSDKGIWKDDFDKMALKTVTKLLLSGGDAPLSTEVLKAINVDQAVINDLEGKEVDYIDGQSFISKDITLEELEMLFELKKELLSDIEIQNASRIIKGKEIKSYVKLYNLLNSKNEK